MMLFTHNEFTVLNMINDIDKFRYQKPFKILTVAEQEEALVGLKTKGILMEGSVPQNGKTLLTLINLMNEVDYALRINESVFYHMEDDDYIVLIDEDDHILLMPITLDKIKNHIFKTIQLKKEQDQEIDIKTYSNNDFYNDLMKDETFSILPLSILREDISSQYIIYFDETICLYSHNDEKLYSFGADYFDNIFHNVVVGEINV